MNSARIPREITRRREPLARGGERGRRANEKEEGETVPFQRGVSSDADRLRGMLIETRMSRSPPTRLPLSLLLAGDEASSKQTLDRVLMARKRIKARRSPAGPASPDAGSGIETPLNGYRKGGGVHLLIGKFFASTK